jgi:hypothetical protein
MESYKSWKAVESPTKIGEISRRIFALVSALPTVVLLAAERREAGIQGKGTL